MDNRESEVMASSAMIERDFDLIGATAIEARTHTRAHAP